MYTASFFGRRSADLSRRLLCPVAFAVVLWGVGTDGHERGCQAASLVGIWGYLLTKLAIQSFLAEPGRPGLCASQPAELTPVSPHSVHIVFTYRTSRFRSPISFALMGSWVFTCGVAGFVTVSGRPEDLDAAR